MVREIHLALSVGWRLPSLACSFSFEDTICMTDKEVKWVRRVLIAFLWDGKLGEIRVSIYLGQNSSLELHTFIYVLAPVYVGGGEAMEGRGGGRENLVSNPAEMPSAGTQRSWSGLSLIVLHSDRLPLGCSSASAFTSDMHRVSFLSHCQWAGRQLVYALCLPLICLFFKITNWSGRNIPFLEVSLVGLFVCLFVGWFLTTRSICDHYPQMTIWVNYHI